MAPSLGHGSEGVMWDMRSKHANGRTVVADGSIDSQRQIEYAMLSIQELASSAVAHNHSGTIGVEIPVNRGRLGKVKQIQIVFQSE